MGRVGEISKLGPGICFYGRTPRRSESGDVAVAWAPWLRADSADRTLFSVKSGERLSTSSHPVRGVAGAFASDKSRTARRAGRPQMLRYKMSPVMGLRDLLTSSGWRSCGQDRKVSVRSMSSRGRAIAAVWVGGMIRGGGVGRLERYRYRDKSRQLLDTLNQHRV